MTSNIPPCNEYSFVSARTLLPSSSERSESTPTSRSRLTHTFECECSQLLAGVTRQQQSVELRTIYVLSLAFILLVTLTSRPGESVVPFSAIDSSEGRSSKTYRP